MRVVVVGAALAIPRVADGGFVLPAFSPSNFAAGAPINNPYFPLPPGTVYRQTATVTDPDTGQKGFQVDEDAVGRTRRTIGGVSAEVVRARSWLDGRLIEDTRDYYAQDKAGNVWYLGEDTKAFTYDDAGHVIATDTSGTFRAGVHGAKPGYIMPAHPAVGFSYIQESAPADQAEDQAKVLSLNESVTVPFGSFKDVLETEETSPVEPGVVESKFYAKGVGVIRVFEDIQPNGRPLNTFTLQSGTTSSAVPLPTAVWPGLAVLACAIGLCSRARRIAGGAGNR